jgi:hypothetical protein
MGARIVALDQSREALDVLRKRIAFYQQAAGTRLNVEIIEASVFEADLNSQPPLDGLLSVFAFNLMQPSSQVLRHIGPWLSANVRIAILDGNVGSWPCRLSLHRSRDVWSAEAARENFQSAGFAIDRHTGGVALPPLAWTLFPRGLAATDAALCRWMPMSISHLLLARSTAAESRAEMRRS